MNAWFLRSNGHPTRLSRLCAAWMLGTVLLLIVAAASPALHQCLHPDADHADHECAITLFAQGIVPLVLALALALPTALRHESRRRPRLAAFHGPTRYLHIPGRAPPPTA